MGGFSNGQRPECRPKYRIHREAGASWWPAAAAAERTPGSFGSLVSKRSRPGNLRALWRGPRRAFDVRSQGHTRREARVPAVGSGEDPGDDTNGARVVQVVG